MLYLVITVGFQMNYLYMFWVVGSRTCLFPLSALSPSINFADLFLTMPLVVEHPRDIIRIAALLRGTESAAQAVSYGINSTSLALNIASAINFALWGLSLVPGWLVVRTIGIGKPSLDDLRAEGAESEEVVSSKPGAEQEAKKE